MITLMLDQYITYAGNLFACMYKRATIMQNKAAKFDNLSTIARDQIYKSMQEYIEDCLTLQMETTMDYVDGFPHETYWTEIRLFIDKYRKQPWRLYEQMKNNVGNGIYASFFRWYAIGIKDDLLTLETWAEEVRI